MSGVRVDCVAKAQSWIGESRGGNLAISFKHSLLAATASVGILASGAASAQIAPSGGFYMADGTRSTDYQAAVASWRADKQFAVDYSKAFMGLEHAYARGLTGRGQTIGVNDAGIYMAHPLFQSEGKVLGLRTAAGSAYGNDGMLNPRSPWRDHGTHVAGTAAGDRVAGATAFGNAFGAKIYSATANFSSGDFLWFKDVFIDKNSIGDPYQNVIDLANTGQVRIINNSWGSPNRVPFNASMSTVTAALKLEYGNFYNPVLEKDVLVVFSAGNGGGVHAGLAAATPLFDTRLRSNWLSVANYASATAASPTTSLCGQTATWCVAGPGHAISSSVFGYVMDSSGLRALYPRASYSGLYSATTVAALEAAALAQLRTVLKNYSTAKATGGAAYDEDAARREVARQAVAITLIAGSRISSPDSFTGALAALLVSDQTLKDYSPEFSRAVLTYADAELTQKLKQYISYKGSTYGAKTGTSMAAPNVSGFAALLMENFPEYNTALISDILVSSAKDLDTPGVDLRSGWGAPQMDVALNGPTALRATRDVTVALGTADVWSNNIGDARDRYSDEVKANFGDDIGGLTKKGGGELILTGTSDYSGPTRVEGGLLTVSGALTRSDAAVAQVGMIGGTGRLFNLTAESGGVVVPGDASNPFGALTVTGDALFRPGSYLWIRSNVNGRAYSRLLVGGATRLEGGDVILKADNGEWHLGSRMDILQSTGPVTGAFSGTRSDLAFLTPVLTYAGNGVVLSVRRNDVTVASLGANRNQRALGRALDKMIDDTTVASTRNMALENALLDASTTNVRSSLRGMTGEVHASLGGVAASDARAVRDAMSERGRRMAGDADAQAPGRGVSVWGSAVYGDGRSSAHGGRASFRSEASGYLIGAEKALSDTAHVGVALGQGRSELRASRLRSTGRVQTDQIGVYGGVRLGDFDVRAGGSWADADIRTDRTAQLNQFSNSLVANYDATVWQAYGELAWSRVVGRTVVEPYGAFTHVAYEAVVREKGGDAALSGRVKQTSDLVSAGLRARTVLAGGDGRPRLSAVAGLAYTHDLNRRRPIFNAAFADGPRFRIRGADPVAGAVATRLAFNIQPTERTAVELGYAGLHKDDYRDNRLYGRFSVAF